MKKHEISIHDLLSSLDYRQQLALAMVAINTASEDSELILEDRDGSLGRTLIQALVLLDSQVRRRLGPHTTFSPEDGTRRIEGPKVTISFKSRT